MSGYGAQPVHAGSRGSVAGALNPTYPDFLEHLHFFPGWLSIIASDSQA
jgi:hypothetical protein